MEVMGRPIQYTRKVFIYCLKIFSKIISFSQFNSNLKLNIEKLAGGKNYSTWKFAVKSYLQHKDLLESVNPGTEIDAKIDHKDLLESVNPGTEIDAKIDIKVIVMLVEQLNFVHIENAKSSKEVWMNLQNAFEDYGLSRIVGLLRDLINTSVDNYNTVEDYVNKIMSTSYKLQNIVFELGDDRLGTRENQRPLFVL